MKGLLLLWVLCMFRSGLLRMTFEKEIFMVLMDVCNWRSITLVAVFLGSLSGCASLAPAPDLTSGEREALSANLKEKYTIYQHCMAAETDRFSHITSAPPSDIALGAQAGCEEDFRHYQHAVIDQFTAVVSGAGQAEARKRAREHVSEAASRIRNRAIRRVLTQRQ